MIRFITEDRDDSPFVKLFNAAYPDKVLYCAGANTKLVRLIRKLASEEYQFVVYLDMVPDNREVVEIYDSLYDLYKEEHIDVVVFPIVCAEYAFIRSVIGVGATIYSPTGLDIILSKSLKYISLVRGGAASKNFEKFCKSFCERCLNKSCCAVESNKKGLLQPYFADGCMQCDGCSEQLTLAEKADLFLKQYPVVPCVSASSAGALSWDAVLNISYGLVDEYNYWCIVSDNKQNIVRKRNE